MAKFKVGDRVTDGSAIYAITGVDDDIYEWKVVSGKADPSYSEGGEVAWAEAKMRRANAARNAKFKVGDKVKVENPPHHTSDEVGVIKKISGTGRPGDPVMAEVHYGEGATWGNNGVIYASPSIMRLANASPVRSTNAVVRNALAAQNATMGEIKAQLNPAKIKEAYQQLRKAADGLDRCIPALKASNIAKAWPRTAEMYGEARSKLSNLLMQFEGELQDMIR